MMGSPSQSIAPTNVAAVEMEDSPSQSLAPANVVAVDMKGSPPQSLAPANVAAVEMEGSPSQSLAPTNVAAVEMEDSPSQCLAPSSAAPPQLQSESHAPSQPTLKASASAPPQGETKTLSQASSAPTGPEVNLMHKNRLIEYCQKSGLPMPVFQAVNEGSPHAPRFRCTVWVYGKSYASPNTFLHRRAADQDAAKLALEQLLREKRAKAYPSINIRELLLKEKSHGKMILIEFSNKMNMGKCTYETVTIKEPSGTKSVSSLVLNGTQFEGVVGKNKKEAERLAALAAILSFLDNPTYEETLTGVVMRNLHLFAAYIGKDGLMNCSVPNKVVKITTVDKNMPVSLNQQSAAVEQSSSRVIDNNMPGTGNSEAKAEEKVSSRSLADKQGDSGVSRNVNTPETVNAQAKTKDQTGHGVLIDKQESSGVLADGISCDTPATVSLKPCDEAQLTLHESKSPHSEPSISQQTSLAVEPTPSETMLGQDSVPGSSKKRRRYKKNKANKRLHTENNDDAAAQVPPPPPEVPLNQPQQCSVAQ